MTERGYRMSVIADAMGGVADLPLGDDVVSDLVIDSRRMTEAGGALFIALPGTNHDGHGYVKELAARGLRNALVARPVEGVAMNTIRVADTRDALQRLAAWHRRRFTYPVIGITGSNGKTIVKEWAYRLLHTEERIVRSPGSWNSQVGVPLSVWEMNAGHTLGLFEAGISRRGEMERLQRIIAPTIGILTNIGPAHGEGFADDGEKAREKLGLFREAEVLITCSDDAVVRDAVATMRLPAVMRDWSRERDAYVRIVSEVISGAGTLLRVVHAGNEHELRLPFHDSASVENAMHCITLLFHMGRSAEWINVGLAQLTAVEMRSRATQGVYDSTLIDDSYSSDLASLRIALDHQVRIAQGRERVVVLGDIAESGSPGAELYSEVARILRNARVRSIIGVGPAIGSHAFLFPSGSLFFPDVERMLQADPSGSFAGTVVLVKGARAIGLERAVRHWQQQVHGTVLEVDMDAVRHNLDHYRSMLSAATSSTEPLRIMAMVKAFGYGSGALELARLFAHDRVHYLGVAYADEGIELRQQGITLPILVMNPEPVSMEVLHRFDLEAEVYDRRSLTEAIDYARNVPGAPPVHVKLDTGMHRLGFVAAEMPDLLDLLSSAKGLRVASLISHLAASEDPEHDAFTREQISRFTGMVSRITEVLGYQPLRHIANSAGASRFPEARFDMVRLGIGLHGIGSTTAETALLRPTVSLRTVVAQVKEVPVGESVSYGRRFLVERPTRIAVLPIGYADGLSRRLGNGQGRVYIGARPAPFVGSICMDMCMVDVTDTDCSVGDTAVVFDARHPLQDFARDLGTIPYEVLTSISQRVKRVYTHA